MLMTIYNAFWVLITTDRIFHNLLMLALNAQYSRFKFTHPIKGKISVTSHSLSLQVRFLGRHFGGSRDVKSPGDGTPLEGVHSMRKENFTINKSNQGAIKLLRCASSLDLGEQHNLSVCYGTIVLGQVHWLWRRLGDNSESQRSTSCWL